MNELVARFGDRMNPIIVREVRQGLRTRLFWACFSLMLFICLVISLVAFGNVQKNGIVNDGPWYFFAFFFCSGIAQFFIIPYSAYRSLAREREDETWVLLTLTGMGPRRILRGKVGSYLVQAILYFSAAGPFLLFSYYLNGIDLPTIGVLVALGAVYTLFLTSVSVSVATLAESRVYRGLLHFGLLGFLLMSGTSATGIVSAFISNGAQMLRSSEAWTAMGIATWAMFSYAYVLFESAASRLSLLSENYSRGPRLAVLFQLVGSGAVVLVLAITGAVNLNSDALLITHGLFLFNTVAVGLFLCTDHDGQTAAQRAGTGVFSLFRPGALRGFRFTMMIFAIELLAMIGVSSFSDVHGRELMRALLAQVGAVAYGVLFLSLTMILSRLVHPLWSRPMVSRLVFLALTFVACAAPPIIGLIFGEQVDDWRLNILNPILGVGHLFRSVSQFGGLTDALTEVVVILCVLAAGAALLADRILAARDQATL